MIFNETKDQALRHWQIIARIMADRNADDFDYARRLARFISENDHHDLRIKELTDIIKEARGQK